MEERKDSNRFYHGARYCLNRLHPHLAMDLLNRCIYSIKLVLRSNVYRVTATDIKERLRDIQSGDLETRGADIHWIIDEYYLAC
jgi:hypothetical protein